MSAKLKQKSVHALLLAFVLASILFLLPDATVDHDSGFMSSELEVKETVEENVTNTSYVNSDGAITDAIGMGYATVSIDDYLTAVLYICLLSLKNTSF